MKFSLKFALVLCLVSLCSTFSFALAQTSSITSVVSPTTVNLNSVYLVNNATNTNDELTALDAWAVGDSGTILHWNATAWTNMTSPTTANLYTIHMINDTNAWAGGGNSSIGVLINLNGTTWNVWNKINFGGQVNSTAGYITDSINSTINSMSFDNATSAWAVGGKGTVLYWTGIEWDGQTNVSSGVNLRGVSMVHGTSNGSTQAWAVGDTGRILAWTGTKWIPEIPIIMAAPLLLSIGLVIALLRKSRLTKKAFSIK